MEQCTYLIALIGLMTVLLVVDYRLHVAFFYSWKRSIRALLPAYIIFIIWDLLGIRLSIFYPGNSRYALHVLLAPKFPIEELVFLFDFIYLTLLLFRIGGRSVRLHST
jgi:lycopene cyclase domain-containing protein